MYIIFKNENPIGVCRTRWGAKRAAAHFRTTYFNENGHLNCDITVKEVFSYPVIRAAHACLTFWRAQEYKKLSRIEKKEIEWNARRRAQAERFSSLY